MFNKMSATKSTLLSSRLNRSVEYISHSPSRFNSPFKETLPSKFTERLVRKPCDVTMLTESQFNPEKYCIRTFGQANSSRLFQMPVKRNLANPGVFSHLARETTDQYIRLRAYEDFGASHNELRVFQNEKTNPILIGEADLHHNSSLEKVWREPRKHRDNGLNCSESLVWKSKAVPRQPYKTTNSNYGNKNKKNVMEVIKAKKAAKTYKELHQSSQNFKALMKA